MTHMTTTAVIVGAALAGFLLGRGRAAHRRPLLLLSGAFLTAALVGVCALSSTPLLNAVLLVLTCTVSSVYTAATGWRRTFPDVNISVHEWARREIIHPRYARDLYANRSH